MKMMTNMEGDSGIMDIQMEGENKRVSNDYFRYLYRIGAFLLKDVRYTYFACWLENHPPPKKNKINEWIYTFILAIFV